MHRKVKWFNNEKGYGFIEYDNLEEIFVHYSAIVKDVYKTLSEGELVNFKLVEMPKGLKATDVVEDKKFVHNLNVEKQLGFFSFLLYLY